MLRFMEPEPPTQGRTAAILVTLAEAAISAVPIVGGPVATLLTAGVGGVVNRRLTDWFAELARDVDQLAARVDELQPERLADSDAFADAVMTAARIVEKTSQQEKLDALRNAVVNSVLPRAPDADYRASFFAIVDDLTPTHLRLLMLLDNAQSYFDARTELLLPEPGPSATAYELVAAALPKLLGDEFADKFFADLSRNGLVSTDSLRATMVSDRSWYRATSAYGRYFLAFIAEPVVPE